jgi:hypothetical protein
MAASSEPTHFYVTLLSNASHKLYLSNTLSSFTVHLVQPIDLGATDRWKVGVCEVSCGPLNVGTYARAQVISTNNALIYCDLISQKFEGSQYVMCLRTFIVPTTYCNHVFDVYYIPVKKSRFQDIQIQILKLEWYGCRLHRGRCACENPTTFSTRFHLEILAININVHVSPYSVIMKDPLVQFYLNQARHGSPNGDPSHLCGPTLHSTRTSYRQFFK